MPYIKEERRLAINPVWGDENFGPAQNAGELNYQITMLIKDYYRTQPDYTGNRKQLNYQVINDIVGALEGAKLEFCRRVAAPYEDTKIQENGDVY